MLQFLLIFLVSLGSAFMLTHFLIPRLKANGLVGKDVNKQDAPEVAEMGGIAVIAGVTAGILTAIFIQTFVGLEFNLIYILAVVITIHSIAFIGFVDDLIDIPQLVKALLPLFAAIPLVAVKAAGSTSMVIPFIGSVDFGLVYILVLIPIGVAVASNLTNMLAGFNGMEAGMGTVIFAAMAILGWNLGNVEVTLISLAMLGALLGFLWFNRYPSKVFPGDVATLAIGTTLAATVIVGNIESAGAILVIPYVVDFFIKAANRFPSRGWNGIYRAGKLCAPQKPVSFAQYVMKFTGGIKEKDLSMLFIALEGVFAIIVLALYMRL